MEITYENRWNGSSQAFTEDADDPIEDVVDA
jgi:hypothetical protein